MYNHVSKVIIVIMNLHCTCNQYFNLEVEPDYIVVFGVWRLEIRVTVIFQVYILWYNYIHAGIATLNWFIMH